jgi:hypothetical protein
MAMATCSTIFSSLEESACNCKSVLTVYIHVPRDHPVVDQRRLRKKKRNRIAVLMGLLAHDIRPQLLCCLLNSNKALHGPALSSDRNCYFHSYDFFRIYSGVACYTRVCVQCTMEYVSRVTRAVVSPISSLPCVWTIGPTHACVRGCVRQYVM